MRVPDGWQKTSERSGAFFILRKDREMGGRGSSFGAGSGSIEGRISSIEKEIEGLGVKTISLFRSAQRRQRKSVLRNMGY